MPVSTVPIGVTGLESERTRQRLDPSYSELWRSKKSKCIRKTMNIARGCLGKRIAKGCLRLIHFEQVAIICDCYALTCELFFTGSFGFERF